MRYQEFLNRVAELAEIDPAEADGTTRAVLATLADHLTGGQARQLAQQLPEELQAPLLKFEERAAKFSLDGFYWRVGEREGVGLEAARRRTIAVFSALEEAASAGEVRDVRSQLPEDFRVLFHAA